MVFVFFVFLFFFLPPLEDRFSFPHPIVFRVFFCFCIFFANFHFFFFVNNKSLDSFTDTHVRGGGNPTHFLFSLFLFPFIAKLFLYSIYLSIERNLLFQIILCELSFSLFFVLFFHFLSQSFSFFRSQKNHLVVCVLFANKNIDQSINPSIPLLLSFTFSLHTTK